MMQLDLSVHFFVNAWGHTLHITFYLVTSIPGILFLAGKDDTFRKRDGRTIQKYINLCIQHNVVVLFPDEYL